MVSVRAEFLDFCHPDFFCGYPYRDNSFLAVTSSYQEQTMQDVIRELSEFTTHYSVLPDSITNEQLLVAITNEMSDYEISEITRDVDWEEYGNDDDTPMYHVLIIW